MINLIKIGLIFIPFYELVIKCFPFASVLNGDTREGKLMLFLMIALGVFLWSLLEGKLKPFQNKGIPVFLAYAFLCMLLAPAIPLFINSNNSSMFWMWKQFAILLISILFIVSIASMDFKRRDINSIVNIITVCAAVMSAYAFIQWLGMDQFFIPKTGGAITSVTRYQVVGVLGQPTLLASFLAICLPVAMCAKKPFCFMSLLIGAALLLVNSKVALISGFAGVCAYFFFTRSKVLLAGILLISILACVFMWNQRGVEWADGGRFQAWKEIIQYWKTPLDIKGQRSLHTITGFGLGSYEYLFPSETGSKFLHPHNEYIYILFNFGIAGLGIVLLLICEFLWRFFREAVDVDTFRFGFMASFITALFCAGGTFILGLGAHSFYLAIIVGILLNTNYLKTGGLDA